ncbi:Unknown protein [Striga hermonthica]|uniref:Small ribosomal subunit protein mS38 n=1 Tax=Striga hermonthica TaxID=68872 RepID=A0A9N7RCU1_STRHE|nr:Unknown protein [Striga hermonthica]
MASPTLWKLLRNPSASKISTFLRQTHPLTQIPKPRDTTPLSNPPEAEYLRSNLSLGAPVYPSFPFGLFLGPVSQGPSIRPQPDSEMAPDESIIIRADSVKKKRKKKMNKHKLRKLRRRLMRKT